MSGDWSLLGLASDPVAADGESALATAASRMRSAGDLSQLYAASVMQFEQVGPVWRGAAASAWSDAGLRDLAPLCDAVELLTATASAWQTFGATVIELKQQSQNLLTLAYEYHSDLASSMRAQYEQGASLPTSASDQDQAAIAQLERLKSQAIELQQHYIAVRTQLVRQLEGATSSGLVAGGRVLGDTELQAMATIAYDESTGNTPDLGRLLAGMSPALLAALFSDFAPGQGEALAHFDPTGVGNLNGVPLPIRALANHDAIEADIALAQSQGDTAKVKFLNGLIPDGSSLILYDPAHDHYGVLWGNINATHIAVFVPGVGDDGSMVGPGGWISDAKHLFIAAGPASAVIMWKGYNDPGQNQNAAVTGRAEQGGKSLAAFCGGGLNLNSNQTLTIVAHSYGSVVTGVALARDGLKPTNVVVMGSPGMTVDNVSELHLNNSQFFAEKAPQDPIANDTSGFGTDPSSPGFGGYRLSTNASGAANVMGHGEYFTQRSKALTNLADVVNGQVGTGDELHQSVTQSAANYIGTGVTDEVKNQLDPGGVLNYAANNYSGPGSGVVQFDDHVVNGSAGLAGTATSNAIDSTVHAVEHPVSTVKNYLYNETHPVETVKKISNDLKHLF